jgi:thiamine-phosphate pyrophosphorylase
MQQHPLVAIGGIDESRLPAVLQTGVGSVAMVRAITDAPDPKARAQDLMKIMQPA